MSNYRFIKELIKNAKKVTKNADDATELKNLAKDYVQTQDDIKYNRDFSNIIRNNNPEEIVVKYPDSDYMYINNPDFMEILANDAENEAKALGKLNVRKTKAKIDNLLEAILLNKQAQENSKKLAINQAINAREYNYPNYLNFNDYSYVRHMNKRLYDNRIRNGIETDKYKKSNIPYLNEKEDDFNDLPF